MAIESLKDLRRRIRSINQTRKTTRAMEMVSAAKLRRAQQALVASRPYAEKLTELLHNLSSDTALREHPLFQARQGDRKTLVVFTGDRGLCGAFNTNLINAAEQALKARPEIDWKLVCVGRRGRDYFVRRQWPIAEYFTASGAGVADPGLSREIADFLLKLYTGNETDEVLLLHSHFVSTVVNHPVLEKYLNLSADEVKAEEGRAIHEIEYIMEPSRADVLDALLPRYLASRVHLAMSENMTSEHSSRMIAMNNATKNCDEMGDDLTLRMNKARQSMITTELLEIVAGAEALKAG